MSVFQQRRRRIVKNNDLPKVDHCEVCKGRRGGVPGNENIVDGKVLCDYCHADHKMLKEMDQPKG